VDDQIIYSRIDDELASGRIDQELWDTAVAEYPFNAKHARKAYIRARFEKLRAAEEEGEWGWAESERRRASGAQPAPPSGGCLLLTGFGLMLAAGALKFGGANLGGAASVLLAVGALLAKWYQWHHAATHKPQQPERPIRPLQDSDIPIAEASAGRGEYRVMRCMACEKFLRFGTGIETPLRCPHCGVKQFPREEPER
jgi:hypothetical protein